MPKTHKLSKHPLHDIWTQMKRRCHNEKHKDFYLYGQRGIHVCHQWKYDFKLFYDWCMNNGYEQGLYLDRIDNDGNYSPDNCRFTTNKHNCRNQRRTIKVVYQDELWTLNDLIDKFDRSYATVKRRINSGWSVLDAVLIDPQPIGTNQYDSIKTLPARITK